MQQKLTAFPKKRDELQVIHWAFSGCLPGSKARELCMGRQGSDGWKHRQGYYTVWQGLQREQKQSAFGRWWKIPSEWKLQESEAFFSLQMCFQCVEWDLAHSSYPTNVCCQEINVKAVLWTVSSQGLCGDYRRRSTLQERLNWDWLSCLCSLSRINK